MKYQKPVSAAAQTPNYDTDTTQASFTNRPRAQNGVSPGTVAARVQFLQGRQGTGGPRPGPAPTPATPPSNQRHENSRTGFGRRLTNRFGPPALQSGQPFEESEIDTSHSFFGLNTPRKSHVEEHGLADDRVMYSKSPGINGKVAQVVRERAQFDAVGPWRGLSRSKSSKSIGRSQESQDMDGHRSDGLAYDGHLVAETTVFPLPMHEDDPTGFGRELKAHEADTVKSECSFATSSTIRRQSVRDLFDDYGIERPEGLASSNESSFRNTEDTTRSSRPHRFCHMCAWVNSGPSMECWRCSHRLCLICDAQSPQPRTEASLGYSERFTKSKGFENKPSLPSPSKQSRMVESEPTKQSPSRPGPTPIQRRGDKIVLKPRKRSSSLTTLPDYHPKLSLATGPSHHSHPSKTVQDLPQTTGHPKVQVRTSIKDSPFLIADSTAKKQSITLFPFDYQEGHHHSIKTRHEDDLRHDPRRANHSSSSANSFRCERSDCPGACCEHQSHRYMISQTKKEHEKQYTREETENGYVADTSRAEEEFHQHSHKQDSQSSLYSQPTSSRPQSHAERQVCHTHEHRQESTHENYVPEFVKCHGYPRTGHIRHGSCSGAELVGECQHCVEDCPCVACQSTHHNVRCCTHKSHKAIAHHHHTPWREFQSLEIFARPPSALRTSIPSSSVGAKPPRPQSPGIEPALRIRNSLQHNHPRQELSTRPSREKVPSIPLIKKSSFIKGASKPPTPPPWVSQPRSSLLKPPQCDLVDEVPNEDVPDPFAPLRKAPPMVRQSVSNEQRVKILSIEQAGTRIHAHSERPASYKIPEREKSTVKEKRAASAKTTPRSSSRISISPPGSRRASRRLSALLQIREQDSIPALTQKLIQHQDELREPRSEQPEGIKAAPSGGVALLAQNLEQKQTSKKDSKKPESTQQSRMTSRAASTDSTRKWRLRLGDKKPSPPCGNDSKRVLSEHRLEDDKVERSKDKAHDRKVMAEARVDTRRTNVDEHECSWKRMALEVRDASDNLCNHAETAGLGIMGVTVVLHFDGREDMVLRAGSWTTTGEPRVLR